MIHIVNSENSWKPGHRASLQIRFGPAPVMIITELSPSIHGLPKFMGVGPPLVMPPVASRRRGRTLPGQAAGPLLPDSGHDRRKPGLKARIPADEGCRGPG